MASVVAGSLNTKTFFLKKNGFDYSALFFLEYLSLRIILKQTEMTFGDLNYETYFLEAMLMKFCWRATVNHLDRCVLYIMNKKVSYSFNGIINNCIYWINNIWWSVYVWSRLSSEPGQIDPNSFCSCHKLILWV